MSQTENTSLRLNRRQFLAGSAAAGLWFGGYWTEPSAAARRTASPNEKLNLAIVGTANKGWHNVEQLASENIVALCDVDARFLNQAAESYPRASRYRDYRKMLESENGRIDAVVVSTADHTHAPATSVALDLGKHVYCEKPLTHTVTEARAVARLAARNGLATQMGTQIHAENNYRRVVELVRSGLLGRITEVHCWCNKGWSDGKYATNDVPTPTYLDWDLWLGPAPRRGYAPNVHPANWRRFWEYGGGTFGDMACHVMDLPFWALELRHPTEVQCDGPPVDPVGTPAWAKATYRFDESNQGPLTLTWSDGGAHFDQVRDTVDHSDRPLSEWGLGILFVGENGMLVADYGQRQLLPQDRFADESLPDPTIEASIGHWKEWTEACKNGTPTSCNFDYSGALTEAVLLGIVAYRTEEPIRWNATELSADVAKANEFIRKEYRQGFEVVGI